MKNSSPPYEGGVDAASADGVVLFLRLEEHLCPSDRGHEKMYRRFNAHAENHPVSPSKNDGLPPLLRKEGSF